MNAEWVSREIADMVEPLEEWSKEDRATLELIVRDIFELKKQAGATTDPQEALKFEGAIERSKSHVALLVLSRVNVTQQNLQAALLRIATHFVRVVFHAV